MQGHLKMNAGLFEEISDCWSSEEQPALYYRTAAARARRLQADATTPRVKQYLDKMIVHCERLAGKVEQAATRHGQHLRRATVAQPQIRRGLPPCLCDGGRGESRHWRLDQLLQPRFITPISLY